MSRTKGQHLGGGWCSVLDGLDGLLKLAGPHRRGVTFHGSFVRGAADPGQADRVHSESFDCLGTAVRNQNFFARNVEILEPFPVVGQYRNAASCCFKQSTGGAISEFSHGPAGHV